MSSGNAVNNENEIEKRRMQITALKKAELAKEPKRIALVELGNQAVTKATLKETYRPTVYKHVKPRVDCHWKVADDKEKKVELLKQKEKLAKRQINPPCKPKEVKIKNDLPKIRITRPSDESKEPSRQLGHQKATIKNISPITKNKSLSQKLLSDIENIDEGNGNLFLVNDYANDVYNYLFELENCNTIEKQYLENHVEITPTMRTILIDWLSETHTQFQLVIETYLLTVALVDVYLQNNPETLRKHLQLVGCTALFVAAKYEEVYAPDIKEYVYITDKTYTEKQICKMERRILAAVNFQLGQPLSIQFLRRFSKAGNAEAVEHLMGKYFIELVSIEYSMTHLKKSLIAAASLYLAMQIYQKATSFDPSFWTSTLEYYSKYSATDLQPVSLQIIKLILNAPKGPKNKYYAIYSKYSKIKNDEISKKLVEPKAKEMLQLLQGKYILLDV